MKMKHLLAVALMAIGGSAWAQSVGDVLTVGGTKYEVKGENLFVNGSFDDGVDGWKATNYTTAAVASNFTITATGGVNDGAYITTNGAGAGSEKTIRQSIAVENGKMYYFSVCTSGKAPSSNNYNYNALFKMTDASTENGVLKAFEWPQGAENTTSDWNKTEYVFTASTSHVGVRMGWNASSKFDEFVLCEVEQYFDLTTWNNAKSDAQAELDKNADTYATTERAAVESAMAAANPTDVAQLNSMVTDLQSKVAAYTAQVANEKRIEENKDLTDAIARIMDEYPNSSDQLLNSDISKWKSSTYVVMNSNQHWSGASSYKYYEQSSQQWGQNSWNIGAEETVNLPAGKYAFVVTARASSGVTSSMTVNGETVALSNKGDVGYGIATNGEATYDSKKTFANGNGRGWEYAYIEFELTEAKDVTFNLSSSTTTAHNWVSIANPILYYSDDAKEALDLAAAKASLKSAIEAAPAVPAANVGDGVFQYSSASVQELEDALETAQNVLDNAEATLAEVNEQIAAVNALTAPTLTAPTADEKFNIVLTYAGWGWDNKAMTYLAGDRSDMGNYNIQYKVEANSNYAQAFTMTQVEGNKYNMSQIDADGVERYISTGVPYGGNTAQIRTTTDAEKALVVEIRPTATEGVYNLWNTEANQFIGSQDAGVYTVNSHIDFKIVEAVQIASPAISAAGYATYVAPVATKIPVDATVYTVESVDENDILVMTEVTDFIPANTVVILEGSEVAADAIGYANVNPAEATVTTGLLTGVYTATAAPVGSYVLQNQSDKVGFYVVEEAKTVPANRAYLTVSASEASARAFFFGGETAISAVEALTSGKATIYNANGVKINSLQKGINIVNGKKIMVK